MGVLDKFAKGFALAISYTAYVALVVMMVFVGIAAVARAMNQPIIGDIEIVQLCMVVLVAGSMAYTEHRNGHVEVGIIADHFPKKIQKMLDLLSLTLTAVFCLIAAYAFYAKFDTHHSSILLGYKYYPLKILLIVGFISWAIMAIQKITVLLRQKEYQRFEE